MNNLKLCAFADESDKMIMGQIDALQRNDIEYIELRNINGTNISEISTDTAKEIKSQLSNGGVKVWSIGSPFGKIKITDDFAPHLDLFKKTLDNAKILGAECIRLFSFYTDDYSTAVFDEITERLNKFIEAAKGYNIVLCHENEKGIYGDIASRCLEIHKALPEIKCIFDPANYIQCNQETLCAFEMLKDYVYYLHIKDATSDGKIVPAGYGVGNLETIIKEYNSLGGKIMTLEPHLKIFDGLSALEGNQKTDVEDYTYKTNEEAFDVAVNALKAIVQKI